MVVVVVFPFTFVVVYKVLVAAPSPVHSNVSHT
ncbi:MAG: hypothetical protein QOG50_1814, partial [Actinomycetota bacterium]|nr:hypothetical protein [Actinomycetota bacterium]